jgi:iron complex outermembrane receptor protein
VWLTFAIAKQVGGRALTTIQHRFIRRAAVISALAGLAVGTSSFAAEETKPLERSLGGLEEIVVTATKRDDATVQQVPLAMTAFSSTQLAEQQFRNLETLAYSIPNVQLSAGGAIPGAANFSIRGLGIASTIPSIDPTVGVFVDGVYQGITTGVLYDTFDLESVEVLRGPQGLLFGKNVTGGAVLVRTSAPRDEFFFDTRVSAESGENYTAQAVVTGPVIEDRLSLKAAAYYNDDGGYFTNEANGKDYGGSRTWIGRFAARFTPTDSLDIIARYEHGDVEVDDTPVGQNRARYPGNNHDVEGSEVEGGPADWDNVTLEANLNVGFGDGKITSITGYRELSVDSGFDVDALSEFFFHARNATRQDQFSEELRYAGTFGAFDVTTGLYYFTQDVKYVEQRLIGNGTSLLATTSGGGTQETETSGVFLAVDWHITDDFTLNLGARYSYEKKEARIARIRPNGCDMETLSCATDFEDSESFDGVTPKIGFQWQANPDTQLYAFWTRGFRSGGYNLRNVAVNETPGPFDDERQSAVEAGLKTDLADQRVRLNVAVFYSKIEDMQREINFADPDVGTVQLIRNTADAEIQGVEVETSVLLLDGLRLNANVGITDGKYDHVSADLNRDGTIDNNDLNLEIPRLSPLTYGIGADYSGQVSGKTIKGRVNYSYRDANYYTDANTVGTKMRSAGILDASLGVGLMDDRLTLTVYGRNLLDDVTENTINPLPPTFGGPGAALALLNKGRTYGVSIRYALR